MSSRRRHRHSRAAGIFIAVIAILGVFAVAVIGVTALISHLTGGSKHALTPGCTATADGASYALDLDQSNNAAIIAAVAVSRGLPAHAVTVALATAMQESKLHNLSYGDRDSLGLFQQRPSQGWGTAAQIMDPYYAAGRFYDGLVKVPNWATDSVAQAAQAVQKSADGSAYAAHEPPARAFASALTGNSQNALTCTITSAATTGSATTVGNRITQDFGNISFAEQGETQNSPAHVVITQPEKAGSAAAASIEQWAYAQWAVAVASTLNITEVDVPGWQWTRSTHVWVATSSTAASSGEGSSPQQSPSPGTVRVTLSR